MPRLIGVGQTLDLLLDARPVDAARGLELGFIDKVLDGDLQAAALAYTRGLLSAGGGPRPTGARSVDPATASEEIMERLTAVARKRYPNRQAPLTAIEAVRASALLPLQEGLLLEDKLVNAAKLTVESRAAVHVFFAERECRRVPGLSADAKPRVVKQGGIIGAGTWAAALRFASPTRACPSP
jgi:3-hydroxyacyl-CoA dehydrogenase